jgi:hypothetical protein
MTRHEAYEYWLMRYNKAKDYNDPHWEAEERAEHHRWLDAMKQAMEALKDTSVSDVDKPRKWAISRPKNGISLNGREYVCDENHKVKLYDDINVAMLDLAFHGYDTGDMEREGIEIVEMQDCGDHYEPIVG